MQPLLVVTIKGEREWFDFDNREDATKFAIKHARKTRKQWSIQKTAGDGWIVMTFLDSEWQGWHYSQLLERLTSRWTHFVVTPDGTILTADRVPVIFEDGNCSGLVYVGDCHAQRELESHGGYALPVSEGRIVGNKVFIPGVNMARLGYIGDPDYNEKVIVGDDPLDWELVDIKVWVSQHESGAK